jgi:hypothetical protein
MAARKARAAKRAKRKATPKGANGSEYLYALGPLGQAQIRIEREGNRLRKWALRLKSYNLPSAAAVEGLERASNEVDAVLAALSKIPKDWRPARGTVGATPIEEGAMVCIRAAYISKYEDILDVNGPMKVLRIVGGRVVLDLGKNVKMPLPRAHVVVV